MIDAIKEIGEYALSSSGKSLDDLTTILVQDPASTPQYKHVLAVILQKNEHPFSYRETRHEEYKKDFQNRYLYRKGPPRGTDLTPTTRITDIKRTFEKKFVQWFSNASKDKSLDLSKENKQLLIELKRCIDTHKEQIYTDLESAYNNFQSNEHGIITLIIKDQTKERYLGDHPLFVSILHARSIRRFYFKYNKESKAINKICSVCTTQTPEVFGFVDTYKFYTVDKQGFVTGGFDQSQAWKNYPVCSKCALTLEVGKKYVDEYLNYKSYGFDYFIIPRLFTSKRTNEVFNELKTFREELDKPSIPITGRIGNLFSDSEEEILEVLAQKDDFLNFNFMFFEKDQSAFRILLLIEDVFPSYLNRLFAVKRKVDNKSLYAEEEPFSFKKIWVFFPRKNEENQNLSKYFLELTYKIFSQKKINYHFLIRRFIQKIRFEFRNNYPTQKSILSAWQILEYLNILNLLHSLPRGGKKMVKTTTKHSIGNKEKLSTEQFFSENQAFFDPDQPAKRAIFLEGILTQKLLNIQYRKRKSTPFRSKLHGLKLDERLVRRLLPEIQNKLEEYDKNYYYELEKQISYYFIQAGEGWKIPNDEISFYFVLGMNLHNITKKRDEEGNNM